MADDRLVTKVNHFYNGSKRRRRFEARHLTRNRKRQADKRRQVHAAVINQLETTRPAAIAVEAKSVVNLMRSARGKGRRQKAGLNRALATVGLGQNQQILNQSQGGMCICRVLGIGAGVSRECFGP